MKRLLSFILVLSMLLVAVPALATEEVTIVPISAELPLIVKVNGEPVEFPDAAPFIDEANRTQIPIGVVSRAMDMQTEWLQSTQTVNITRGDVQITIVIGSNLLYIGEETVEMDTVAIIKDDRTFIPVRFVAESLGYEVLWNEETREVDLNDKDDQDDTIDYQPDDSYKLSTRPKPVNPESFDFEILKAMPKDKNYVVSPASLRLGLALLANGTADKTQEEVLDVLGAKNIKELNDSVAKTLTSAKSDRMKVSLDTSAWYNAGTEQRFIDFAYGFKILARDIFDATLRIVYDTDGATRINAWIAEKTNGLIESTVSDVKGDIGFIINSTYLKGQWAVPFDESETKQRPFIDRNQKMQRTEFMMDTGTYNYYGDPYIRMIAKPYYDRRFKMYIVLTGDGRVPTEEDFKKAYNNMKSSYVHLEIPKFDIATSADMINKLTGMGIHDAFVPIWSRFTPMYEGIPKDRIPYASIIKQEARLAIDEKGTDTPVTVIETQKPDAAPSDEGPIPFVCDQPFSFFVMNDETGDVIYVGEFGYLE